MVVLFHFSSEQFIALKSDATTLTSALKVSNERASTFRDALSVSEPEPTAESMVPTSSSSFCRVCDDGFEFVGESRNCQ